MAIASNAKNNRAKWIRLKNKSSFSNASCIYFVWGGTCTLRMSCWQSLLHSRAGAGGDCLQASAAGGFGLPTPAEWTHSVSCCLSAASTLFGLAPTPLRQSKLPAGVPSGTGWLSSVGCFAGKSLPRFRPEPAETACRPPRGGASACPLLRSGFCGQSLSARLRLRWRRKHKLWAEKTLATRRVARPTPPPCGGRHSPCS